MRLKQNSSTAIVVRKSWANLEAIQAFLRERPRKSDGNGKSALSSAGNGNGSQSAAAADDSHTIFARVLDDTDARGLWIELHTKEHEQNPEVELEALMIPWPAVLAVVVANDFTPAMKEALYTSEEERGLTVSKTSV